MLIINKQLQYIGESENLRSRLNVHLMNMRHYLDHNIQLIIKVKCVNDSEKRKELEQMLISRIKPSGNRFRRETILKVMQRRKENESRKTLLW